MPPASGYVVVNDEAGALVVWSYLFRSSLMLVGVFALQPIGASAQSLEAALAQAYTNNPAIAASRAGLRASNEGVALAKSGFRPSVNGTITQTHTHARLRGSGGRASYSGSASLTLSQKLFDGYQTRNLTKQATANVYAGRESLRSVEQSILLSAVAAYMDVIRDVAIVSLRESDLEFLDEQVRANKDRFEVGENTRTDVAQAEARRSAARSLLNLAGANLATSRAVYQQIVGAMPGNLTSKRTNIDRYLPESQDSAIRLGLRQHPDIQSAKFAADAAQHNVDVQTGKLLPTLSLQGTVANSWGSLGASSSNQSASITGTLNIPLYQGGATHAGVRQAKEQFGQFQLQVDVASRQVRATIVQAWGQLQAANASIYAARDEVSASQVAVTGVLEEQKVGQRTTLDVLDTQRGLVNAQVGLVTAQRDRVVAAFNVLAAVGRLNARVLKLPVRYHEPREHFDNTKDKWHGLRTSGYDD